VIYILSNRIRLIYRNICTVPYRNKNNLIDAKTKLNRSKRACTLKSLDIRVYVLVYLEIYYIYYSHNVSLLLITSTFTIITIIISPLSFLLYNYCYNI